MKRNGPRPPIIPGEAFDPELDAENLEFDFSRAPRPGRRHLFERAQGHFHEVPDARAANEDEPKRRVIEARRRTPHSGS